MQSKVPVDLNFETGASADMLDTIVIHQEHQKARERHLEKQRIAEAASKNIVRTTKLSSGSAFKSEEVCLTSPNILQEQLKYEQHKQQQRDAAKERKREYIRKTKIKVNRIRSKDHTKWSVTDYRTLLTYKKANGDPPTSKITDRNELKTMWESRQHRASPTYSPTLDDDELMEDRKLSVNDASNLEGLLQMPMLPTEDDPEYGYI